MSKLVFDATGKYVHPTRYRQIVETASYRQLSSSAQSTISKDQKHSSVVARVHYQKQRSREVASKAHEYLERLHGKKGSELEIDVCSRLSILKIKMVAKPILPPAAREKRSQKHHPSVFQVSRD